jgi:cbb3-type cytochrome oxidase subunit 1
MDSATLHPGYAGWLAVMGVVVYFAVLWLPGFRLKDFAKRGAS